MIVLQQEFHLKLVDYKLKEHVYFKINFVNYSIIHLLNVNLVIKKLVQWDSGDVIGNKKLNIAYHIITIVQIHIKMVNLFYFVVIVMDIVMLVQMDV